MLIRNKSGNFSWGIILLSVNRKCQSNGFFDLHIIIIDKLQAIQKCSFAARARSRLHFMQNSCGF